MKIVFAAGQKEAEAFERELKMLAKLSESPHIVNVIVGRSCEASNSQRHSLFVFSHHRKSPL
jgi:hypothetical protein